MNKRERVYRAIHQMKADKVPKGELEIDKTLRMELTGAKPDGDDFAEELRVRELLRMDIAPLAYLDGPGRKVLESMLDGRLIVEDIWRNRYLVNGGTTKQTACPIGEINDVYRYEFPSPEVFDNRTIRRWADESDFFVFAQLEGGFNGVYPFFGLTEFLVYCCTEPDCIKHFVYSCIEYWLEMAKIVVQAQPDAIMIGDDMAYNQGTMLSPQTLRELIFPAMKYEVRKLKEMSGLPVFLHCDGNINAIMDDIVDMGFDGLHSLQPSAGMDIERIKIEYGDRLCLMGNMDLNYLLPYGSPDEIEAQVRRLMNTIGRGGGYILSTCNILSRDVPSPNALAMYAAGERYGKY